MRPPELPPSLHTTDAFRRFARATSGAVGSSLTFILACLVIAVWAVTGPFFHFSDTWQLVINTSTTIVTFLMVFLIQNTQNRDAVAIHLKLDELLRAVEGARTGLVNLESLSDEELVKLQHEFEQMQSRYGHDAVSSAPIAGELQSRERHRSHRARLNGQAKEP